jgi:peptidoglycan/xylan/chitin deacetylase (PgdA/CDA1 family)
MMNAKKKPCKHSRAILVLMFAVMMTSSCAGLSPVFSSAGTGSSKHRSMSPMVFESKDYIVYRLKGNESPAMLAERFLKDRGQSWVIEDANEGVPFEKGQIVIIPLREENRGGLTNQGYQTVPVLCYHHFDEDCHSSLCTPVSLFEEQMRYLKENGYRVIPMRALLGFLNYRYALPQKAVILTIDDGYRSAYDIAFPILKKHGFTATLFIYTDFIEASTSALTWDHIRAMKAGGFEVGSHTLSHCDLTKRREGEEKGAYLARIVKELRLSKQIIDDQLNQDTVYLAFPYGEHNQRILSLCEQVGYKMGFSVRKGGNPFFSDPLTLRRNQILRKDMRSFVSRLTTFHHVSLR